MGQTVYHKWVCDTPHDKLFCMKVAGCTVDDGSKDKVLLLDENGCAVDKYLLGNLEYTTDLIAWREVHVFKYADRVVTYFQCQIEITLKEPNGLCPKPVCTYNNKGKREILQGNHSKKTIDDSVSITDVMTEITTLSPENLNYNGNENTISHTDKHRLCLNRFIVWSMVGLAVVFGFICVALFAAIRFRNLNLKLQT